MLHPARLLGILLASYVQDKLGRKITIILANLAMISTALLLFLSTGFTSLLLATCMCGASTGMVNAPSYGYLSEISLIR